MDNPNTIVITDDTQLIFKASEFWNEILNNSDPRICVSFSRWGFPPDEKPPGVFAHKLTGEFLVYTHEEFVELMSNLQRNRRNLDLPESLFCEEALKNVFLYTCGYPNLIYHFIEYITSVYIKQPWNRGSIVENFFRRDTCIFSNLMFNCLKVRSRNTIWASEKFLINRLAFDNKQEHARELVRECFRQLIDLGQVSCRALADACKDYTCEEFERCLELFTNYGIARKIDVGTTNEGDNYFSFFNHILIGFKKQEYLENYNFNGFHDNVLF